MPRIMRVEARRSTYQPQVVLRYVRPAQNHSAFDRLPLDLDPHRWHADYTAHIPVFTGRVTVRVL